MKTKTQTTKLTSTREYRAPNQSTWNARLSSTAISG